MRTPLTIINVPLSACNAIKLSLYSMRTHLSPNTLEKEQVLSNFFSDLLGSPGDSIDSFDLHDLFASRSLDSHANLVKHFHPSKAILALHDMNPNASPRPDGFGPSFFKKLWNLTSPNIVAILSDFHDRLADLRSLNKSFIVLIPKKRARAMQTFTDQSRYKTHPTKYLLNSCYQS